jgi:hypothetical protein
MPAKRTMLLDSTSYPADTDEWAAEVRWPAVAICPLGRLLHDSEIRFATSTPHSQPETYLYARLGTDDAFAFPDLLPGSIVRVDRRQPDRFLPLRSGEISRAVFLVELTSGMLCCRLRRIDKRRVALHTPELPYAQVPLELDREARIRGIVDLEMRHLTSSKAPEVPPALAKFWKPGSHVASEQTLRLGSWIRMARLRSALHFREASAQTAGIAQALGDSRYFVAYGSLSDYETSDSPPRHMQKILSLCVVYSLGFRAFLEKIGLPLEQSGRDPFPPRWLPSKTILRSAHDTAIQPPVLLKSLTLQTLVAHLEGLPHFLAGSLPGITGLPVPSVRDIFWLNGNRASFHPYLRRALFMAVDRLRKRPRTIAGGPISKQPIYLLQKRNGDYLCGRCSLEGNDLIVHPFSNGLLEPARFRNQVDAEIVGQIVTVVRHLMPEK